MNTFLFLIFFFLNVSLSSSLSSDLIALLSLKSSLSSLHDWDPAIKYCSWSGVRCSLSGEVVSLNLSGRNLSGTIPPQIKDLDYLSHLNLSHNAFQGPFPASIFELKKLHTLDINHNYFNSTFPPGIGVLKALRILNCYSNSFTGFLPGDLSGTTNVHLQILNLGGSYFEGGIPGGYGGFGNLTFLYLAGNNLVGLIPPEIGRLQALRRIEIGYNAGLSGEIPPEMGMLSNLNYMDISSSNLTGRIPPELGNLTMLDTLLLFSNRLSGPIPSTIADNLRSLEILDLSFNELTGEIPKGISLLKSLSILNLQWNNLTGKIPPGIGDLTNLTILQLWNNSLTGTLPENLGIGGNLEKLDVSTNSLSGPLPENLCKGNKLVKLMLFSNRFSSGLPGSLTNCTTLNRVRAQDNLFTGAIPTGFGNLPNLTFLDLSDNNFSGEIPTDFADSLSLGTLNLSHCNFNSQLPENIWRAPNLQILSASGSGIVGRLPDFEGCKSIYRIDLERNSITGTIPWKIGHCEKLVSLNLGQNSLTGIIPPELSMLPEITDVNLSNNLLNGTIPANFDNCTTLEIFNVSYNRLTGPIPSSGALFADLHPSSFAGNAGLCGTLIRNPCTQNHPSSLPESPIHSQNHKSGTAIVWITAAAFGIGLFILLAGIRYFQGDESRRKSLSSHPLESPSSSSWNLIAFQKLNFTAEEVLETLATTDKIIGIGSTGTVYMAEMPGGETIAVKKLWGKNKQMARGARTGSTVLAEVDVLGSVRHRNIVRLLGCCNNRDTTMLLYEYMPNGSLDELLHGTNKRLFPADWVTRLNIALGVAHGICYLHHDCDPVIVHRDLKPSNILLDANMDARVADFGLAKLVRTHESMSVVAGSYGYIAPEYAYTLQVDEKSDIYSFGVVLLEILTGKRSVEAEFGDGHSIVDWVRMKVKLKDGVDFILDKNAGASCPSVREEMVLVLRLALLCTSRNPADRPSMRDVVSMLNEAMPRRKLPDEDGDGDSRDHVVEISYGGGESMGTSSSFEKHT